MLLSLSSSVCGSFFFFSSRRRHTRWPRDWSSDVCSSDLRRVHNRPSTTEGVSGRTCGRSNDNAIRALAGYEVSVHVDFKLQHADELARMQYHVIECIASAHQLAPVIHLPS